MQLTSKDRGEFDAIQKSLHLRLARFNKSRLKPDQITDAWAAKLRSDLSLSFEEGAFLEEERKNIHIQAIAAPWEPQAFVAWFEKLKEAGPGQGDILFSWLAESANLDEMKWFLTQEAAGEAGFDDLVALAQLGMPRQAKLEMARNYWDEMGRGHAPAVHGSLLAQVVTCLELAPTPENTVWESLALANLMAGLALNRRYAYQIVGALGAIEMTAPGRVECVNRGLKRLGVADEARTYFQLHAGLDVKHSEAWNAEVVYSLVKHAPAMATPIAEGALMRLAAGARCFERYRAYLL